MIEVRDLAEWPEVKCPDGVYRPGRPLPGSLRGRIQDAVAVLRGHAVAVRLYDGGGSGR